MQTKASILLLTALALTPSVQAHGLITRVFGANGVVMPGLNVVDGTPRSSTSAASGAQADSGVIRDSETGGKKASALGRTSTGPLDGTHVMETFMGKGLDSRDSIESDPVLGQVAEGVRDVTSFVTGNAGAVINGVQDGVEGSPAGDVVLEAEHTVSSLVEGFFGTAEGKPTPRGYIEDGVKNSAGAGAECGLPTCGSDGTVRLIYHQVNEDGAGPLSADCDYTSGGKDPKAFKSVEIVQNLAGVMGFSTVSSTDFPIVVKIPAGKKCTGTMAGVENVCVVRVRNAALAGPFGGSAVFTNP